MKILWGSLAAVAVLAVLVVWLLLDRRSGREESERLHAELRRSRQMAPPPPPAPEAPKTPPSPPSPSPAGSPPPPPVTDPAVDQIQRVAEALKTITEAIPRTERPGPSEIPGLQAKAMDVAADPKERLAALSKLRSSEPDGRSPEVVRSMIDLLRTSPDGRIRADICRQLSRIITEELKQQLLVTARTDVYAKAREEAVEDLGHMKADPLVQQALETILATDIDADVRQEARRSLERRR